MSAAWQTTRSVAVLDRALSRVTTQSGMVPLPGRAAGARLTWRPSTVLHKGQAALVVGVVAGGLLVSGLFLTRDFAPRTAVAPARPRIITPAAPTVQRLAPRPAVPSQTLRRTTRGADGVTPVGNARPRREPPRTQLGPSPAPAPATPRRVPRRTA